MLCDCASFVRVDVNMFKKSRFQRALKGLLTAKGLQEKHVDPRLELISGQMAANMARNVCQALKQLPIVSVTVCMDSIVALETMTSRELKEIQNKTNSKNRHLVFLIDRKNSKTTKSVIFRLYSKDIVKPID